MVNNIYFSITRLGYWFISNRQPRDGKLVIGLVNSRCENIAKICYANLVTNDVYLQYIKNVLFLFLCATFQSEHKWIKGFNFIRP